MRVIRIRHFGEQVVPIATILILSERFPKACNGKSGFQIVVVSHVLFQRMLKRIRNISVQSPIDGSFGCFLIGVENGSKMEKQVFADRQLASAFFRLFIYWLRDCQVEFGAGNLRAVMEDLVEKLGAWLQAASRLKPRPCIAVQGLAWKTHYIWTNRISDWRFSELDKRFFNGIV